MRPILLSALFLLSACEAPLGNGELGNPRYFGEIPGEVPMRLLPPVSDRDGNVYVAYGNRLRADTDVWVGRASGGWNSACSGHRGDFGDSRIHWPIRQRSVALDRSGLASHLGPKRYLSPSSQPRPCHGQSWTGWQSPLGSEQVHHATPLALVRATNANESYLTLLDLDREQMTKLDSS